MVAVELFDCAQEGIKVTTAEMATLNIEGDAFHPEWNYTIRPRRREAPS
jgi:hypothetical protein